MMIFAIVVASMMTEWGGKVTPENAWREYPRPQMVRGNWTNLNGEWDYAVTSVTNTPGRPEKWDGKILVPFAIESALSGVGKLLEPDQFLWYSRKIQVKKSGGGGERTLLHFGGVDFRTMVFIGHKEVTDVPHESGQNPFTLDITDYVTDGENELTVCVWDPTDTFINNRGKQVRKPGGCHYTRVSGIWQTVWMETVPEKYIRGYKVVTDIDKGDVKIEVEKRDGGGQRMSISAFDGDRKIGDFTPLSTSTYSLHLQDFECWSPEKPKLYTFTAKYGKDEIKGYFGMRKFEKRKDAKGILRFFLNNKPYYVLGTLDQGWWPDGLLTPPSDEAMAYDIKTLKDCGFNAMRKHIKVEPLRYYYLCDTMGILVLQDMPCTRGTHTCPMEPETVKGYGLYRQELRDMMDALQAVPSVVMWVPYNEGWGQCGEFLTHSTLDFVKRYDPTRLVNGPSGCWDWEGGQLMPKGWAWKNRVETAHKPAGVCEAADTVDMHLYRHDNPDGIYASHKVFPVNDRRISFLGEFGGLGHPVEGHLWRTTKGNWGYGGIEDTKTCEGLEKTYLAMMDDLANLAERGLGGSIYTQTTDVEIEVNGLMTYDRKVLKFDPAVLRAAHKKVIDAVRDTVRCADFGTTKYGERARLYTLTGKGGLKMEVTDYGGRVNRLWVPDAKGELADVTIGFDSPAGWESTDSYFGAIIGRFGNRIADGAFTLDGRTYRLAKNDADHHACLHGGMRGWDGYVWAARPFEKGDDVGIVFTRTSRDGEEGFPGNVEARVTYTITPENAWRIEYEATTDRPTPLNLTQHVYFNLDGEGSILGQDLMIAASKFSPVDADLKPVGPAKDVAGTPFDFRAFHRIGERIDAPDGVLQYGPGYDHNWVLDGSGFRKVAEMRGKSRRMEVWTDQIGLQFYAGNFIRDSWTMKDGRPMKRRSYLALETQHFPNSPNRPDFPSTILKPGETYRTVTEYRFGN